MRLISRRTALRLSGKALAAGPALWLASKTTLGAVRTHAKSRVAIARRDGLRNDDHGPDTQSVRELLDRAVASVTGQTDPDTAWAQLFSARDTVGIKVNTLGGAHLSPHPVLVECIAKRLIACGIPPARIVVWDRFERELQAANLVPASLPSGIRVAATDTQGIGYETQPELSGSIGSCFTRILTQFCTALINVGILKHHDLSGTSIGMKNLFGVIHNPNKYHFHVNKDPYLADLCLHPYIRTKQRLIVCDAIRAQYDGGPAYHPAGVWSYDGFIVSQDIVAIDAIGTEIIETRRKEAGLPDLKATNREPLYLEVAESKGIGWADRSKIEVIEIS